MFDTLLSGKLLVVDKKLCQGWAKMRTSENLPTQQVSKKWSNFLWMNHYSTLNECLLPF